MKGFIKKQHNIKILGFYLVKLSKNAFFRNVATLAAGTIISQIIVVGASPFLTRLYTVESFGLLSLFTSLSIFFGVITTGRYELAIALPSERRAKEILNLIFSLGAIVSCFYLILIYTAPYFINGLAQLTLYRSSAIYLLPIYTFIMAIFTGLGYWNQRNRNYKRVSIASAIQAISTTAFSLILGALNFNELGMIIALIIGMGCATIYLLKDRSLKYSLKYSVRKYLLVSKQFESFPKYMLLSDLSLAATQQFIPVIFSLLYNSTVVGYYSLANRLLRLPIIVIVSAISNVFRNDALESIKTFGNCENLYKATLKKLIFMSLPIFIIIFLIAPMAFEIVFGPSWIVSGQYSRLLCLMLFTEFIALPLNSLFYIRNRQKEYMLIQLFNAILSTIGIYLGLTIFQSSYASLLIFSVINSVFNLFFLLRTYQLSIKKNF